MEKLDRERKGGGGREEQAEVAEEGPLPPPPFSRMKFELLRWSFGRLCRFSRPPSLATTPKMRTAMNALPLPPPPPAAIRVPDIFQGKVIQRTITIISCF